MVLTNYQLLSMRHFYTTKEVFLNSFSRISMPSFSVCSPMSKKGNYSKVIILIFPSWQNLLNHKMSFEKRGLQKHILPMQILLRVSDQIYCSNCLQMISKKVQSLMESSDKNQGSSDNDRDSRKLATEYAYYSIPSMAPSC